MSVNIEKGEIWSDVTIAGRTSEQTSEQGKIELLRQRTMDAEMSKFLKLIQLLKEKRSP